ncbi:MAG: sugar ABC transporter permease [Eubacteriales bacterium]
MNKKNQLSALQKRNNLSGFIFLLPLIIIFICLMGYSFYFLIRYSFFDVTIAFKEPEFVGFSNFQMVLKDSQFYRALFNTFLLSSANIFFGLTIAFLIAVFLNFSIPGKRFFHALFFVPSMLPIALMAAVFNTMLQYKDGLVNNILRAVGLDFLAQRWLADPNLAMFSIMSVSLFLIGIPIMYYTADLTTISSSILEAATIDGARMKDILIFILYPMLKNTHKTIILSMILGGFREMDRVFLMTDGGPGGVTEIVGTYIYRSFKTPGANLGRICAISVLVAIISFTIGFVQMRAKDKS